jgi:alanine dehydrogenase
MKDGSVIIDVSIDQGGCVETSRPMTLEQPTFVQHGVVHYCVGNMTANVPRTASRVLTNVALPFVKAVAKAGVAGAIKNDTALASGICLFKGKMVNRALGEHFGLPTENLNDLLG